MKKIEKVDWEFRTPETPHLIIKVMSGLIRIIISLIELFISEQTASKFSSSLFHVSHVIIIISFDTHNVR